MGASKTSQWRSARYHSELSRWQSQPKRSLTLSIGVICRLKQTILQPLVMATVSLTPSSSSSRDQNLAVITVSSWQLLTMESSGAEWETSSSRLPVRQYKGWKINSKHVRERRQRTEVGPLGLECPGRPTGARSSSQTHGPTMPLSRPLLGTYRKTSELSQPLVKGKLFVEGLPMIFIIQFIFFFSVSSGVPWRMRGFDVMAQNYSLAIRSTVTTWVSFPELQHPQQASSTHLLTRSGRR